MRKGDEFLNRLCDEEEEGNDNNINDHDEHEEDANVTEQHSIFNELVPWKKQIPILGMRFKDPSQLKSMLCNYAIANGYQLCFKKNDRKRLLVKCCKGICKGELLSVVGRDANNGIYLIAWAVVCVENKENWRWFLDLLIDDLGHNLGYGYSVISDQHKGVAEALNEDDEGNQSNAVNDGGTVNDGGEAVNEVHVQQDYDEVELTPLEFDVSTDGEPSQVHVQEQEARETPLATLLKKIRRKKSERIINLKLGKKVGGANALGNSEAKPVTLE
ncbi:unnamed protein product [Lactuca saligna]|uniref:Transposase MuDR plant domain-containing protein n=1 Tax=Lactuca saligna TaxID=75948 RepID=A0AA35YVX0_LACSI|nr:unnamed protein product [Lactuca saligna]